MFRRQPYGWRAFVFTGNPALAVQIGLPVAGAVPLYNGRIPCQLIEYDLS